MVTVLTRDQSNKRNAACFEALKQNSFFTAQNECGTQLYLVAERIDTQTLQVVELSDLQNVAAILALSFTSSFSASSSASASSSQIKRINYKYVKGDCINAEDFQRIELPPKPKTRSKHMKRMQRYFDRHVSEMIDDPKRDKSDNSVALWIEKTAPKHKDVLYEYFNADDDSDEDRRFADDEKYLVIPLDLCESDARVDSRDKEEEDAEEEEEEE